MTKYDKELQTGTEEYEEAIEPKRDAQERAEGERGDTTTEPPDDEDAQR